MRELSSSGSSRLIFKDTHRREFPLRHRVITFWFRDNMFGEINYCCNFALRNQKTISLTLKYRKETYYEKVNTRTRST